MRVERSAGQRFESLQLDGGLEWSEEKSQSTHVSVVFLELEVTIGKKGENCQNKRGSYTHPNSHPNNRESTLNSTESREHKLCINDHHIRRESAWVRFRRFTSYLAKILPIGVLSKKEVGDLIMPAKQAL